MNLKRGLISGLIVFAIVFLLASILMFVLYLSDLAFQIPMLIMGSLTVYLVTRYYYFKEGKVSSPIKEGIIVGILIAIVSFVLDIIVMVYGFAGDLGWAYFNNWSLISAYILTIFIPIVAAYMKK